MGMPLANAMKETTEGTGRDRRGKRNIRDAVIGNFCLSL
jgi:hypothetical protein